MSPRELVILILGLAIVAVVLRGLFVAMQGRRGQLRLAIDKNIPRDVDLNALELAELPSGGARVVARSFSEVNRQNHVVANATAKAATMHLGDRTPGSASIPVLMDPVVLNSDIQHLAHRTTAADAIAEGDPLIDDADDVLFDYGAPARAVDNLSQVAPDYPDDEDELDEDDDYDNFEEDFDEDDEEDDYVEPTDETENDDNVEGEEFADDDEEDDDEYSDDEDLDDDEFDKKEFEPLDEEDDDLIDSDLEDELGYVDDDLDEFSMTAGDRIGFTASNSKPVQQSSLFSDEEVTPVVPEKARRKSLFAGFSRKASNIESPKVISQAIPAKPGTMTSSSGTETARPTMMEKPSVIVAKPEPARAAPVQESQRVKATAVEPVYEKVAAEPSEVVVLNVMAKPGRTLLGDDLLHVLITSGMKFGDMNIFHRRLGGESKGPIIFSIANILNPGTFDLNRMHEFTTMGVSLFLALPTTIKNLDAFDQMLNVAQQICGALDGELRDDNRNLMTAQTIEHYRQRIRDFELRRLKAVGTRG